MSSTWRPPDGQAWTRHPECLAWPEDRRVVVAVEPARPSAPAGAGGIAGAPPPPPARRSWCILKTGPSPSMPASLTPPLVCFVRSRLVHFTTQLHAAGARSTLLLLPCLPKVLYGTGARLPFSRPSARCPLPASRLSVARRTSPYSLGLLAARLALRLRASLSTLPFKARRPLSPSSSPAFCLPQGAPAFFDFLLSPYFSGSVLPCFFPSLSFLLPCLAPSLSAPPLPLRRLLTASFATPTSPLRLLVASATSCAAIRAVEEGALWWTWQHQLGVRRPSRPS